MDQFAARMCECRDLICAKRVYKAYRDWDERGGGSKHKGTKRWEAARERYYLCYDALIRTRP